jgi:hypothetical protein
VELVLAHQQHRLELLALDELAHHHAAGTVDRGPDRAFRLQLDGYWPKGQRGGGMVHDELIDLERRGWEALSASPDEATAFYDRVLDAEVAMLLPGGMVIDDRASALAAMGGQPWASYALADERVLALGDDAGVVLYAVVAERSGAPAYSALVSSTYVRRDGGWRLAAHQQTPR